MKIKNFTTSLRQCLYLALVAAFSLANVVLAAPEITVFDGLVTDPQLTDSTGTQDFGSVNTGSSSTTQTFTIRNDGTADLTGIAVTKAVTGNPGDFTVNTAGMLTTLAPNASTSFTLTFSPAAAGARSAVVEIASSDADENPFEINLGGTGVSSVSYSVPELIYYQFNGTESTVPNLASSPVGSNPAPFLGALTQGGTGQFGRGLIGSGNTSNTDYVNTGWATSLSGSWTISLYVNNIPATSTLYYFFGDSTAGSFRCFTNGVAGANNLLLRGAGLTDVLAAGGAQVGVATVTHFVYDSAANQVRAYVNGVLVNTVNQPSGIAPTGTGPFKVCGYSSNVGLPAGGLMDEFRLYNRALSGAEVANTWNVDLIPNATTPEIAVFDGSAPPAGERMDNVGTLDFRSVDIGSSSTAQTFTIRNDGTANLTGIAVNTAVTGNPGDFTVNTAGMLTTLAPNATTSFTITFSPTATGSRAAVVEIASNDADENPFDITLSGTGLAPEVVVHNGSHSLAPELSDGQVTAVSFGSTAPNVASVLNFLVRNTGDADLDITTITVPSGYTTNGAAAVIAPGADYGFQVSLESATPATYAGSITINSDDLNEAAFDFPVTGSVVAPGSSPVVNVGGDIAVQGTTGSAVLGGPVGSTLYSFIGSPALNSSGVLASAVQIRHSDASLHTGMMSGQPLVLIATDTQTAPSLPGVTYFSFSPPVINETDHIAFTAEVRGAGITKNVNSRCLFSNASDGTLKLVARMGTDVGLGSNLKTLGNFSISGDLVIFLGTLVDKRSVLFGWDANGGLRALVRTGQSLTANGATKAVKSFSILETSNASSGHGKDISVAPTGESLVTISVTFTDGTSGVVVGSFDGTSDTGFGATYGTSQQLADTYATAPGVIPLAKWGSFRSPGFDNTGSYYGFISQMLTNTLAGVSSTNNVGIFVDTAPGLLTLQLRENDAAPGTTAGVVFSDFSDLVLGGGDYEFLVKGELRGAGVTVNVNNVGLWAQHAVNGLELVAREGSEAPGVTGSTFLRLNQIALPGTAQPLFQATMTTGVGGVTTANDTGLWVINESGAVKLAVREGDTLSVNGTPRVVTAITALLNGTTTGGALGRRVFLTDGQMTLLLTFSGGIQANAKVVVP